MTNTTKEESEEWLREDAAGAFLLRRQNLESLQKFSQQDYVLSVKQAKPAPHISHLQVRVYSGNGKTGGNHNPQLLTLRDGIVNDEIFSSMTELIDHYHHFPYSPGHKLTHSLKPGAGKWAGAEADGGGRGGLLGVPAEGRQYATMHVGQANKEPAVVPDRRWYLCENSVFQAIMLIIFYFLTGLVYYTQVSERQRQQRGVGEPLQRGT